MDNSLHEKLKAIENSLPEIEKQLSEIDISKDQKGYAEIAKKHSDVSIIVDLFNEWKKITSEIDDAVELINSEDDEDMKNEFESIVTENKNIIRDNIRDRWIARGSGSHSTALPQNESFSSVFFF